MQECFFPPFYKKKNQATVQICRTKDSVKNRQRSTTQTNRLNRKFPNQEDKHSQNQNLKHNNKGSALAVTHKVANSCYKISWLNERSRFVWCSPGLCQRVNAENQCPYCVYLWQYLWAVAVQRWCIRMQARQVQQARTWQLLMYTFFIFCNKCSVLIQVLLRVALQTGSPSVCSTI